MPDEAVVPDPYEPDPAKRPLQHPDRIILRDHEVDALFDWLEHRRDLPVNEGGGGWTGGFDLLVKTTAYTGRIDPLWCPFTRIAMGTAAVYPYKATIPGPATDPLRVRGEGQWKRSEILAVRVWLPVHPDMPAEIPGERLEVGARPS